MNKVYKVLFNKSIGKYVVVSENSKSAKKSSKSIQSIVLAVVAFGGTSITIAATLQLGGGTATGTDTIAIGENAKTSDVSTIALGVNSQSIARNAVAIGFSSEGAGTDSISIGTNAKTSAISTIALGVNSQSIAGNAVAIGLRSEGAGIDSISIGTNAKTSDVNTIALGINSKSIAGNAVAIGLRSEGAGRDSIAIGSFAKTSNVNAIALGSQATASDVNAIALGSQATASKAHTIALGTNSKASAANTIALGNQAEASVFQSIALGSSAKASAADTVALGTGSIASGNSAIALGNKAQALGSNSISIGKGNIVSGNNSAAIGDPSNISGNNSYSLGNNNTIATDNTFVVGSGVTVNTAANTVNGNVILGNLSADKAYVQVSNGTINGKTYNYAGTAAGVVSLGAIGAERQIVNVAPGAITATSTDAINGSQLHATNEVLGNVANSVETILGGNATFNPAGNITMTNIGNTGKNTIHDAIAASQEKVVAGTNIASVDKVTDAVKGQSTYTVNANGTTASAGSSAVTVTAGTPDANNVTDYAVDLSQDTKDSLVKADTALQSIETQIDGVTVKNVNKDDNKVNFVTGDNVELTANADGSITVGTAADVTFNNVTTNNLTATGETKLGDNFTVTNAGDAYYTGPVTEGNHITNKTYVDQQTAAAKTEVAAGTNVKDVVKTQGTNGQDIYTVNANGTTASAGSSAVTVTAGTPDANNVTDYAVDLSQDTKDSLVKADTALQSIETQIDGVTVKNVNKDDNKVNFVTGDNVELTANADGSITVGTAADVTFNNVTTNNLTATGETKLGDNFTVTNAGDAYYTGPVTEGNHITNKTYVDQQTAAAKTEVAAGTNVKDVVKTQGTNGQDIYTVNANGTTASAGSSAVTVTAGTPDANNVTDYAVDLSQDTKDSLVKADTALQSIETQIDGVTVKNVNKDDNKVNFVTGDNVELTANADGSITVGTAADVTFNNVTTNNLTATGETKLGDNFTVTNAGDAYYTGPVTEGNHITNKTYVDQQTAAAKTEVAAGTNVKDVVKTQGTNGQDIYTVNANGTTASAGSSAVTVTAGTPDANNVTDYAVDLSQDTKDSLVKADTALQSIETQIDGVTVKNVNKDDNKVNFVTGDNVELTANADGSITVGTAADVTFNNVTTNNLTATGETKLGDNFTVTNAGDAYYTGPVTEGNHITNKTYVDQQTAAAKTEVAAGTNVKDVVKTQGTNGQDIYTVNANGTTASAGSSAVTVTAGTPDANNVTDYAVDLSQDTKDSLVKADTALQSIETQIDGVTVKNVNKDDNKVNFVTGDNVELTANADGSITVGTAADVTFNNVTTNNLTATGETKLGDNFTVTNAGDAYYTGPVTEGNHITNKTYVDQQTAAAKTEVAAGTNVKDVVKTQGTNGQDIYTVNANGTTASAGSSAVTVTAGTPDANNVTDYAVDLSQDTKDSLVKADTALQSIETQIDGVTVKNVNKDDNKVNFVTGDNVELTANADGSITVGTAADVTFNNVTTNNLTATGETKLGDNFTVTNAGDAYYTGPVTEGNHITNKTYVDQQTAAAKTEVAAGTNVKDVVKTQGTNGQDIYTVNANGTTASAGSSAVTVTAGTPDANNVTDYAVDLSQDTKDSLVKADTALQSIETQIDGVTVKNVNKDDNKVNFVTGDNVELTANADGSITVGTAADVTFNNVTTNNLTATGETKLGDNFTVTNAGDAYYTGPVTEGNHITNKTYVDQQTAAAKTEVAAGTNVKDVVKTQGTNGQDIYTVNANGTTASAGSSAVTVTAGTPDANNVTDYAVDLSQDTKDSLVKADTALQSIETQIDGVTVKNVNKDDNKVNFVTGDNVELTANADGSITVGTAADVTFNNVTTNNLTATGETKLGDNFTVTNAGDAYYTGPVTEGNHITNKTYVDQQTAAAKTEVAAGTNVKDVVKTQGTNGQDIYTVNANGTTASAGSSAVTVTAGTPDANNVTDYAVDLSQDTKDSLVKADSALQSIETQIDGVTVKNVNKDDNKVNFVTGDNIVLEDDGTGAIKVSTAQDVTFNQVNTTNLYATGETKLGDNFTVTNAGDAYYTGPVTEGNHITNKTYVDQQTAAAKTEVEAGKNITVTPTTGNDGQTIYNVATADEVDFTKVTVGNTTITTDGLIITGGPSITTAGINAGGKKVTDVADGEISEDSTDAVNGSQLHTLGNNVTNLFGGNATYVDNQISWNNIGGTGQNTIDDAIKHVNNQAINANQGWNVVTDSGAASQSTVKPGNTVSITGDAASGVTVTNTGNDITVGLGNQVTIGSGDNAVSIDGNAGTIQVGDIHIDGSKGNITAGQVKVNGEAGTVNGLTNTTWNPGDIVSGQAATEDQLKQVADTAAQAAAAAKSTVTEGENITVTPSKNADGSTNYQVATKKDVTFDSVTSGSVIADKVAVGKVVIDQAGINAGGNKVTNVADGAISSTSKDAINGSQLHASNTNIYNYLGGGANYETNTGPTYNVGVGSHNNVGDALNALDDRDNQLDNKITNLGDQLQQAFYTTNERIDGVEKRANAGIAAAMALETAPYVAGKWTYAAAAAHHGGENAVGVTFRKTADNGRWSLTSGIAAASQGDPSFRIGISGVID